MKSEKEILDQIAVERSEFLIKLAKVEAYIKERTANLEKPLSLRYSVEQTKSEYLCDRNGIHTLMTFPHEIVKICYERFEGDFRILVLTTKSIQIYNVREKYEMISLAKRLNLECENNWDYFKIIVDQWIAGPISFPEETLLDNLLSLRYKPLPYAPYYTAKEYKVKEM